MVFKKTENFFGIQIFSIKASNINHVFWFSSIHAFYTQKERQPARFEL